MPVRFRIEQSSRPTLPADMSRHDLVAYDQIILTAVEPTGPNVQYEWEILDRVGTSNGLQETSGEVVYIEGPYQEPFAFLIQLRAWNNGAYVGSSKRIASAVTPNKRLRVPVFGESADPAGRLSNNNPETSTDNAPYEDLAGTGSSGYNWRGFAQAYYELVLAVENSGEGGGGGSGSDAPIVMSGYYDQNQYPNALGATDGYCTRANGNTDWHQLTIDARPPGATATIHYATAGEVPPAPRRIYCNPYSGEYPGPPLNRNVHEYGTISFDVYTALSFVGLEVPTLPVSASDSIAVRLHNIGPATVTFTHMTTQADSGTARFRTPTGAAYALAPFADAVATYDHLENLWVLSAQAVAPEPGGGSEPGEWTLSAHPYYPDMLNQTFSLDPGLSITYYKTGGQVPAFSWTGYRIEMTIGDPRSAESPGVRMIMYDIGGNAGSQPIRITCPGYPGSFSEGEYQSLNFVEMNVPWGGFEISWWPDTNPSLRRWRVTRRMEGTAGGGGGGEELGELTQRVQLAENKLAYIEDGAQVVSTARVVDALAYAQYGVSFNTQVLTNIGEPVSAQDAATRSFVESTVAAVAGPGWIRVVDVDFTQLPPQTIVNGANNIDGMVWTAENVASATSSFAIGSSGLVIVNNAAVTVRYPGEACTAPGIRIRLADLAPDFIVGSSQLRILMQGGNNGNANHEVLRLALERNVAHPAQPNCSWAWNLGAYDNLNPHNGVYAIMSTAGYGFQRYDVDYTSKMPTNSTTALVGIHMRDLGVINYLYGSTTEMDGAPNDNAFAGRNLKVGASARPASNTTRFDDPKVYDNETYYGVNGPEDLIITIYGYPYNTTATAVHTVKRLRIEYMP
jgi:hypothetical protein